MKKYLLPIFLILLLPAIAYSWMGPIIVGCGNSTVSAGGGGVADPTDQFSANPVFSVGVTATELDNNGTITVASNIATFSVAFPTNVGAGDVVQYDVDNNGTVDNDEYGIIHGISTDRLKAYLLKTAGGNVVNTTATTSVYDIFRAYISLANWENSVENTNIDVTFGLTDGNLTDSDDEDGPLYVACYADGNDTTLVDIDATYWITDVDDYIEIYTPTAPAEVGTSQRHIGKWGASGYKLVPSTGNVLYCSTDYARFVGLQIKAVDGECFKTTPVGVSDIWVVSCILRGSDIQYKNVLYGNGGSAGSALTVINTITTMAGTGCGGLRCNDADLTITAYNCTFSDGQDRGIKNSAGTIILKNCAIFNNAYDFDGTVTCNYCASDDADATTYTDGVDWANEATDWGNVFVDYANEDFHLNDYSGAGAIMDQGVSDPSNGLYSDDIDGNTRAGSWDIGADEY